MFNLIGFPTENAGDHARQLSSVVPWKAFDLKNDLFVSLTVLSRTHLTIITVTFLFSFPFDRILYHRPNCKV